MYRNFTTYSYIDNFYQAKNNVKFKEFVTKVKIANYEIRIKQNLKHLYFEIPIFLGICDCHHIYSLNIRFKN